MLIDGIIATMPPRDRLSPGPRGVRTYVPHKCFHGYTMFSTAFGCEEYLIDMNGMLTHTWPVTHSQYAELLPNGNLMADNYGSWIEEVSPRGERLWIWKGPYHHDFHYVDDDTIYLLTHKRGDAQIPGFYPAGKEPRDGLQSDIVTQINRKGEIVWEFPFRDHTDELRQLAGLPWPVRYGSLDSQGRALEGPGKADWAHTNTIEALPDTPLGRKDPRFRQGNLLFSFRALDIIGVIDRDAEKIVWAWGLGVLDGQHQPTMTPQGTILIFDNGTARGYSAAVEVDPSTDQVVWRYEDRAGFFSAYRAGVQRLPNGNTLIAESDAGRIFEVTPEKEIVWDYYHPFLAQRGVGGTQGLHVYRATRYSETQVENVLAAWADDPVVAVASPNHIHKVAYGAALQMYRDGLRG